MKDGRRGTLEKDLQRCMSRGTRDWFSEMGCLWSIRSSGFAKMTLRDRRSTAYDQASHCHGRRNTLDRWNGKIANLNGTRPSALHSTVIFEGCLTELLRF